MNQVIAAFILVIMVYCSLVATVFTALFVSRNKYFLVYLSVTIVLMAAIYVAETVYQVPIYKIVFS